MIDMVSVGKKIKQYRLLFNQSQDELAEILLVTRQAISRWEVGLALPTIDNLIELSKMYKVSVETLLCIDDKPEINLNKPFDGHDRAYVIKSILDHKIEVDLPSIFYQFSDLERLQILRAIKSKKLKTDMSSLFVKLTPKEQAYFKGDKKYEKYQTITTVFR